ncbi:MAG: hypothetical protein NTZ83_03640, partial [Candidatus Pacearchaeota archaeon]|nr:hypothetical protein [Candidatus Pacearchaeota archaeon]
MEEKKDSSLGKALTMLGLEDQFLSNGELSNFPLAERGKIANDIISEKLRRGRWETVIEMIYGGLGKADALYDGDRNKLRGDIVNSAVEDSKLMTKLPLRYEEFAEIRDYKLNPKHDAEKERILDNTQGKLAFAEQKYNDALAYFTRAGNQEAIDKVFEIALNPKRVYTSGINISLAEEAALSNPDKKESRLKKIVLGYSPGSANPLPAYQLMKKHNIKLSPEENEFLIRKIAGLNDWNFEKNVPESESGIRLLW